MSIINSLIENYDVHGINISFFVRYKGIEIAPFYDLVNIALSEEFHHDWAMAYGDEFAGEGVCAYQLSEFADEIGVTKR